MPTTFPQKSLEKIEGQGKECPTNTFSSPILDGSGLGPTGKDVLSQIQRENMERIKGMTPEEIADARKELMNKFSPASIEFLRKKKLDREMKGRNELESREKKHVSEKVTSNEKVSKVAFNEKVSKVASAFKVSRTRKDQEQQLASNSSYQDQDKDVIEGNNLDTQKIGDASLASVTKDAQKRLSVSNKRRQLSVSNKRRSLRVGAR